MKENDFKNAPLDELIGKILCDAGGEVDETSVSLRFFGDGLDPDEISKLLNCQPTVSYRKSDVMPNTRHHKIAETGSWSLNKKRTGELSLEKQILELLDRLSDDLEIWRKLTNQYHADLFCGLFMKNWNRGIAFSPELMAQISARGLTLDLDIYDVAKTRLIPVEPNFSGLSSNFDEGTTHPLDKTSNDA